MIFVCLGADIVGASFVPFLLLFTRPRKSIIELCVTETTAKSRVVDILETFPKGSSLEIMAGSGRRCCTKLLGVVNDKWSNFFAFNELELF